jgi:hypothetical protein
MTKSKIVTCFGSKFIFENYVSSFYVLLTVHLSIILDNGQLDAHLLYFTIHLLNPLHVSIIICSSSGG